MYFSSILSNSNQKAVVFFIHKTRENLAHSTCFEQMGSCGKFGYSAHCFSSGHEVNYLKDRVTKYDSSFISALLTDVWNGFLLMKSIKIFVQY